MVFEIQPMEVLSQHLNRHLSDVAFSIERHDYPLCPLDCSTVTLEPVEMNRQRKVH